MSGKACLPITGRETSGDLRPFRRALAQVHEVQPGLGSGAAGTSGLRAGYSFDVVDPVALGTADELYKSLFTISEDR